MRFVLSFLVVVLVMLILYRIIRNLANNLTANVCTNFPVLCAATEKASKPYTHPKQIGIIPGASVLPFTMKSNLPWV